MSQIYVFHVCVSVRICIVWGEGVQLINPIPELLWTLEHCPNWSKRRDGITTPRITRSHTLTHSQAACRGGPGPEGGWELKPGRTLLRRAGLQTGKSRTLRAERASYEKQSEQQSEPHIWLISSLLESWWVFFFFLAVRVLVIDWPVLFFLWLVYLWNKCTRKTNKQKKTLTHAPSASSVCPPWYHVTEKKNPESITSSKCFLKVYFCLIISFRIYKDIICMYVC